MSERKPDEKLIEQLKKGNIFLEKPETVDPTEKNDKERVKGGGGGK